MASPPPGVLLASSFDGWWPSAAWHGIWMRDKGMAQTSVIADAGRGSRCLSIRSRSPHDWGMQHGAAFAVSAGDVFAFEGYARTDSAAVAQLSVVTYDEQRTPLNWFFAVENVRSASWVKVSRSFTVPAGVKYVRFRLTGYGIGDAYFDDIKFVKEK